MIWFWLMILVAFIIGTQAGRHLERTNRRIEKAMYELHDADTAVDYFRKLRED